MLTQLSTIKARLALLDTDTQYDILLTNAIKAVSERFDKECNRILARTENFAQEFSPDLTELCAVCYRIESVSKFELKTDEAAGWIEQAEVKYLIRRNCVISLSSLLCSAPRTLSGLSSLPALGRVIYTGGYVLPSDPNYPQTTPDHQLPAGLEQAAVEQTAFWFQNRDRLGLMRIWEYHGTYRQFADLDLLSNVKALLFQYTRWEY
jgi:hypothetical protein